MSDWREQVYGNTDLYRDIVESVNSIIIGWDSECRLTFINKYALQFFGYTGEEVLGKCIIGTIVPEIDSSGHDLAGMIRDILKQPVKYVTNENENLRKNGERVWISWTNKPVLDASGNVTGIFAVGNDITALKKADEGLKKARAEVESQIEERTAELRQSEERYRAFFENSIDAVLITTSDGKIESANPEACRMFGMSEEEIIRAGRDSIIDRSDRRLSQILEERNRTGKAMGELNYRRKDGTIFPGEMSSAVYRDRYGQVKSAIMIRDITERKRTRESLEKYRLISENARDIVLFLRRDGRILEANDAAVNAYGYSREELLSMNIYTLRATDPGYYIDQQLDAAFDQGLLFETLHRRKDGTIFPVEVSSQGRIVGGERVLVSVIRDITVRKRSEQEKEKLLKEVEEQRARLEAIMDSLPVGVFIADASGRTLKTNPLIDTIWGRTIKVPAPGKIHEYREYKGWLADTGKPIAAEEWALARALRNGEVTIGEVIDIERFDGTRGTIINNAAPVRDKDGNIIGGIVVVQDITSRRQIERELGEAKEQAELYVDLMGHDINNLNQSAIGFLELALDLLEVEKKLGRENKSLIEMPLRALQNSSKLIDNVRKLQQLVKEGVKTKPIDLCAMLRELDVRSFDFEDRNVSVNTRLDRHCMVEANELLKDVFNNLISNAIKHSAQETPLVINVRVDAVSLDGQEYYRCIVEDNGPGIPDSLKDKIFYRFQRGATKAHGKGLGLYLVRTLIDGYHGRVWVEDRVPGDYSRGAKFVVLLPALKNI